MNKNIKTRKCKNPDCGHDYVPVSSFAKVCSPACAIKYTRIQNKKKADKEERDFDKETARRKKEFNKKDLRWQHKNTQIIFNRVRVLQEFLWFKENGIDPYCISCKKTNRDWCCGHFKTIGSSGNLRYDIMNTYLQCNRYCNMGLSGNITGNTRTVGFSKGILDRFGDHDGRSIIEYCESNMGVRKWLCKEVESIRMNLLKKYKDLKRDLSEFNED